MIRQVVHDGRRAIRRLSIGVTGGRLRQQFLERDDVDLIDAARRSLRRRIVGPHRLDGVTDELETNRLARARRKKVDDPASYREFSGLVGGILTGVPGLDQAIPEVYRRNIVAGSDRQPCIPQTRWGGESRQQCRRRRHDQARDPRAQGVQRPGASRGHVEVRSQASIGIDLVGRERQHLAGGLHVGHAFERGVEETRVRGELFDLGVGRGNQQRRLPACGGCRKQRLRRGGETADALAGRSKLEAAGSRLEQSPKRQRRRGGGGHGDRRGRPPATLDLNAKIARQPARGQVGARARSMSALVE